ncbi:MAG TPA: Spy/CpxP family protein refolding chaperone, partial [Bacteroidota bacterium]|nr:Spy/CpxP family protein refolding chaperone [Bacteroidota bacterium]
AYRSSGDDEMEMALPAEEETPMQDMEEMGAPRPAHEGVVGMQQMMGKLKLTDEQKKEIDKIVFDAEKQAIAQRAKVATARLELRQLFKADNPDKSAIEKKINEVTDLSTQLHINRVEGWFTINKLLTPDQQKIWKHVLAMHSPMGHGKFARQFEKGRQHPQFDRHTRMNGGESCCPPNSQTPAQK